MRDDYPRTTAIEIVRWVTSKQIAAVGRERAMRQTRAVDELIADGQPAGILAGGPVILKDNIVYSSYLMICARRMKCRR